MEFILYINRMIMRHNNFGISRLEPLFTHVHRSLARKGRNSIFTVLTFQQSKNSSILTPRISGCIGETL
jgi:hypothetical protein